MTVVAVAGCGPQAESPVDEPPAPIVTPTFATIKPAADCSGSDLVIPPLTGDEGVRLEASTDDTGTSLLLKNTGSLSVLVIPDAAWTTRVVTAPHANPTDAASKAALSAVIRAGGLQTIRELPVGIPQSQVFIVPPQWAVCGLTDDINNVASLRYLREKTTSAEYFVAKELADQVLSRVTPPAKKTSQTLLNCAKGTQQLLKERADLPDIELYAELLNTESSCRAGFKALLKNDERATEQTISRILNLLERAPRLRDNTRLFLALAHR